MNLPRHPLTPTPDHRAPFWIPLIIVTLDLTVQCIAGIVLFIPVLVRELWRSHVRPHRIRPQRDPHGRAALRPPIDLRA